MGLNKRQKIRAQIVAVIKTETVEGKGTKEDPVRTVVRYWETNGNLIAEKETNQL